MLVEAVDDSERKTKQSIFGNDYRITKMEVDCISSNFTLWQHAKRATLPFWSEILLSLLIIIFGALPFELALGELAMEK